MPASTRAKPEQLHEWISFDDPDEDRTWVFDATFLLSNHTCIFGQGCQGVLTGPAADMAQGCCSYGAHFVDDADLKSVRRHAKRLTAEQWQFKAEAKRLGEIAHQQADGTWITHLADDACIFLNRPGFEGGPGCALHRGALEAGERPLDWKPDVCWQVPIRLIDQTEDSGHIISTVREWKRRDWGDGGTEFHWWCTEAPESFVGRKPLYISSRDELVELVGGKVYALLVTELNKRRTSKVYLAHPTLRRR